MNSFIIITEIINSDVTTALQMFIKISDMRRVCLLSLFLTSDEVSSLSADVHPVNGPRLRGLQLSNGCSVIHLPVANLTERSKVNAWIEAFQWSHPVPSCPIVTFSLSLSLPNPHTHTHSLRVVPSGLFRW